MDKTAESHEVADMARQRKLHMIRTGGRTYLLLAALAAAAALPAFAVDLTMGRYRLNVAESSYVPAPNPVEDLTVTREFSMGYVKQTTDGSLAGNVSFHAAYTLRGNSMDVPVTGNAPFNVISVKRIDANTTTDRRRDTKGIYRANGRTVFTDRGRRITVTISGVNGAGKTFTQILAFDKL